MCLNSISIASLTEGIHLHNREGGIFGNSFPCSPPILQKLLCRVSRTLAYVYNSGQNKGPPRPFQLEKRKMAIIVAEYPELKLSRNHRDRTLAGVQGWPVVMTGLVEIKTGMHSKHKELTKTVCTSYRAFNHSHLRV